MKSKERNIILQQQLLNKQTTLYEKKYFTLTLPTLSRLLKYNPTCITLGKKKKIHKFLKLNRHFIRNQNIKNHIYGYKVKQW